MAEFVQYLINGLAQGSIYALIALGYTMVYGILKLINFAHGEFYMVGAFMGVFVFSRFAAESSLPPVALFLLGTAFVMLVNGTLAVIVERFAYRPLRNARRIAPLITALGVSIVLLESMRLIAGAQPRAFPQILPEKIYDIGTMIPALDGVVVQRIQLVIFGTSVVLMLILRHVVMKTKIGRAMRALSVDFDASRLMGVPVDRVIAFTFFLGASLAGAAGILVGMYYNQVEPYMGQLAGLKAFTAAVLGGIGVIPGAVMGSLLLGVSEQLVVGYGQSSYRDAIAFGILILVLMLRPWGLMGTPERVKV
ncbi:MAG: branched-chain amino acid ABC transporter permease [Bdellovibrionales bacterium]|nr:branched-chain amino acid ABC transporter permease [Bdellovibrionales bacterium]